MPQSVLSHISRPLVMKNPRPVDTEIDLETF